MTFEPLTPPYEISIASARSIWRECGFNSPLSPALIDALELAGLKYILLQWAWEDERLTPTKRTMKKALFEFKKGGASRAELARLHSTFQLINFDPELSPDEIAEAIKELEAREVFRMFGIPQAGAIPNKAREILVKDLADIFEAATGKKATLRHNWYVGAIYRRPEDADYGPFLDFVEAVLDCINPGHKKGIRNVISAALKQRKSRPTLNVSRVGQPKMRRILS
jgi:hypothetical protein